MKWFLICLLFSFFILSYAPFATAQKIFTIAGTGVTGFSGDNGPAGGAELNHPIKSTVDGYGNVYICDRDNQRIRKVSVSGVISTIAGTGTAGNTGDNGPATLAQLNYPDGIAVDATGNIYVAGIASATVRKINSAGIITTIAGTGVAGYSGDGGPATLAKLSDPRGIALDTEGNLYIPDGSNHIVRKINAMGVITTIAGSAHVGGYSGDGGAATLANIWLPICVAVDNSGNLFIADGNSCIRKVTTAGIITTLAGDGTLGYSGDGGPATLSKLHGTAGVSVDCAGNVYITDVGNNRIRKINSLDGIISTVAGNGISGYNGDGIIATDAELNDPLGIAVDCAGTIYISETLNNRIRTVRSTVSVPSQDGNIVSVAFFPNPNTGIFTLTGELIGTNNTVSVEIFNMLGQAVYKEEKQLHNSKLEERISLPDSKVGAYLLRIQSVSESKTIIFLIQ